MRNAAKQVLTTIVMLAVSFVAIRADAQDHADVAVGYNVLTLFDSGSSVTFPLGFVAAAGTRVAPAISLVGEFGLSHKGETFNGTGVNASLLSFTGGPRFSSPRPATVTPFVQVLFGGARVALGVDGIGSESAVGFAVQPGAGVDVRLSRAAALRLQGDFALYRASGGTPKAFRIAVSAVFRIGKH